MNQGKTVYQNISDLQDRIVNRALVIIAVLACISHTISIFRDMRFGGIGASIYVQSIGLLFTLAVTIFRKRMSITARVYSLSFIVMLMMAAGLYAFGFLASGKFYIATAPVFFSFIISYRHSVLAFLLLFLTYITFGSLYIGGILHYSFDTLGYASSTFSWVIDSCIVMMISLGLLYVSYNFKNVLLSKYSEVEAQRLELADSETKYRTVFECSNDAIILLDNGRYFDCNKVSFDLFKCGIDYFKNNSLYSLSPAFQPDGSCSKEKAELLFALAGQNVPQVFDWQHSRPDGELFDVSISLSQIQLGNSTYIQAVLRDITEKKKIETELAKHRDTLESLVRERTDELEAINKELHQQSFEIKKQNEQLTATMLHLQETQVQLIQSEKMASLGVLTAGVAHEINNPLNFIMAGMTGLENYFEREGSAIPDRTDKLLYCIRTGIDRASAIVSGLNDFSRESGSRNEALHIHTILDNCITMLRHKTAGRISIVCEYESSPITILGDGGKLHQVFLNILNNAVHAIADKGTIKLSTRLAGQQARIAVTDDGCGMSAEELSKITDPFYTTKAPGKGTGLGMSISYSIIQEHRGTLKYTSEIGKGTCATVSLPAKV